MLEESTGTGPESVDLPYVNSTFTNSLHYSILIDQGHSPLTETILKKPEGRLAFAVLEDAVAALSRYNQIPGKRALRLFSETHQWILSEDTTWAYSFLNICEFLHLDPGYIRRGIKKMLLDGNVRRITAHRSVERQVAVA